MKKNVVMSGALITSVGGILLLWGAYHYFSYVSYEFGTLLIFGGMGVSFLGIAIALFGIALDEIQPEQQPPQQQPPQP